MEQRGPAQWSSPPHELYPEHSSVQPSAPVQSMALAHEETPEQRTSQATPAGQAIGFGQS
jgi:hypothetical protein